MKTVVIPLLLTLCIFSTINAVERDTIRIGGIDGLDPYLQEEPIEILMALSGGGARGLSTIGILKALEERNIMISGIAGTSMGGIIGGLYACGYTPAELDSIADELDFTLLFTNSPPRKSMLSTKRQHKEQHLVTVRFDNYKPVIPQGLTTAQRLTSLLTGLTTRANYQCNADFYKLQIPFVTIATDVVSGKQVILDSGSLADAMRATMAFPLAFTGLERNGQLLMDGGMVTPIPVSLAKSLSHDHALVVAVNTSSNLLGKDQLLTPVDIANQVTTIMTSDQLQSELALADLVITPQLEKFNSTDFDYKDTLIQIGYEIGLEMADSIYALYSKTNPQTVVTINKVYTTTLTDRELKNLNRVITNKELKRSELIGILKTFSLRNKYFQLEAVLTKTTQSSQDESRYDLVLTGIPYFRYNDVTIRISGNREIDSHILAMELLTPDSLITPRSLLHSLNRMLDLYHNQGYDLVDIKNLSADYQRKVIDIEIDEAIIRRVDVENNSRTKDWYVRSYFSLQQGELYSTTKADQGIKNIYGTDLFNRVTVNAIPSDNGVIVKIWVEERENVQLRLGWHWDDEYESEEFLELMNDNVGGIGLEYLLHGQYATHRRKYLASFKTDRILSTYLTSQVTLYRTEIDRQLYDLQDEPLPAVREEYKNGLKLSLGQQIARLGTVSASIVLERVSYEEPDLDIAFNLHKIEFESLVETFDQLPFPHTGSKSLLQLQLAGKLVGGDVEYTKFYSSYEIYLPFSEYVNYHPKVALGISRSGLPPTERFYLGGFHSFVGFRTHQLSGDKMFIFSHELRVKLPWQFYLTSRYDMGEVYSSTDQIKLRNLRYGAGIGLAYDSPVGPFEFGYGIVNKDFERFYLNIGLNF